MKEYLETIGRILKRLKENGFRSWDHYDFWGSNAGIALRRNKNALTYPVVGAAYFLDVVFPMLFRRGKERAIPMESLPSLLRAMRVYKEAGGDGTYERDREMLTAYLIGHLGRSRSGRGMGHQFDWYTTTRVPAFTPCVTLSSYPVDYLLESDPAAHEDVLRDIGEFVFRDLNGVENADGTRKVSYTALDTRWVINANSYAARIMYRLGEHFGRSDYRALAESLLQYVLKNQEDDGGWFYFEKGSVPERENFIDCFHTAFVLENLVEWAVAAKRPDAAAALEKGMRFFTETFVNEDGSVNHFAKSHIPVKIFSDIRSCAGAISCCMAAAAMDARHAALAGKVYRKTMATMYDGDGGFYFRDYGFFLSKMNYARWGSGPMLDALTRLVRGEMA